MRQLEKNKGQRRGNTETLLLPGFFELFRMPDGSAIVRPKELANEVSVRQACELLKLSKSTVNWLCDMGHLEWRWFNADAGQTFDQGGLHLLVPRRAFRRRLGAF